MDLVSMIAGQGSGLAAVEVRGGMAIVDGEDETGCEGLRNIADPLGASRLISARKPFGRLTSSSRR